MSPSRSTDAGPPGDDTPVRSDRLWLGVALGVGTAVFVSYLLLYRYPAHGAGLYFAMGDQIRAHGSRMPHTISGYTANGVPFAYPPLVPYLIAVVRDTTGLDRITLARYVPGLLTVAYLVPYYYLARELLDSKSSAGIAAVLLATTPVALKWHLAAGGILRSVGFLFTLTGLYAGVRMYKDGAKRWFLPSMVLFGLTVLTHPVYTTFFGVSYLLLFLSFDRSRRGLVSGVAVAVGGIALASPWWVHVASVHGPGTFTAAAGTHAGLLGGIPRLLGSFVYPLFPSVDWPFYVLAFGGTVWLCYRRRFFLPVWLVTTGYLLRQNRFLFVPGAMAAAVLVVDVGVPMVQEKARTAVGTPSRRHLLPLLLLVCFGIAAVGSGAVTTGDAGPAVKKGGALPAPYMNEDDERAMEWVTRNTPRSARFVVLGDAAEWFPAFTHRTSLVSPWGVEWRGKERFERQKELYDTISACGNATCLSRKLATENVRPDYVYVPKGRYTIRRDDRVQSAAMRRTLVESEEYRLAYENDGVMIFRTRGRRSGER
ncbi:glycosyltransferase family 39 protein [Haladaptatus sp. DYF46]|uniref:glycosyltransferase family 39 protein n=1 Tax=Haladaptatus sp. DYF46 TaxID=2886041 RepID=UPI001E519DCA|nr:glycosyltransferase family 39 protein [Haladaptatus sp. DYF46]